VVLVALGVVALAVLASASSALAAAPWWRLDSSAAPTNLKPGDTSDTIVVTASNVGNATVDATKHAVTINDTLPAGLRPTHVVGRLGHSAVNEKGEQIELNCPQPASGEQTVTCTYGEKLLPYELLEVRITVEVQGSAASGEQNDVTISGGEGPSGVAPPEASLKQPITVSSASTTFGIQSSALAPENEGGSPDVQAGEHPFQLTTTLHFNEVTEFNPHRNATERSVPALAKDIQFRLPPGMIGNPSATEQCSEVDFTAVLSAANACTANTAIGVAVVTINEPFAFGVTTRAVPVFNLTPAPGEPARFGFYAIKDLVVLDTSVRTGQDYGVVVSVNNASQVAKVLSTEVTLWGVPGDPSHDASRGWACVEGGESAREGENICTPPPTRNLSPFLTLPTSCGGELATSVFADSWTAPGARLPDGRIDEADPLWARAESRSSAQSGCERLPFAPSLEVTTETQAASTPTGFTVDVRVPQESTLTAGQLAESAVKDTTLALPQGLELNPAAADGLLTCSAGQVGFTGVQEMTQTSNDEFSAATAECPDGAKVGTVQIKTPLLPDELQGSAYLAKQDTNPFEPPLVLYLIARDPVSGVLVKLAGKVTPDPTTGQLVSVFENTPPLPFEDLKVSFLSGPRASVSTPPLCGTYTSTTSITPWSGAAAATPSSDFAITSGPGGTPCADPQPFAPGFEAGSTSRQAGGFSGFVMNLSRPDADQALSTVTLRLPSGLAAVLASTTPCPEPQASQGTCGPESLIGHTTASSGLGSDPFTLGGQVFITGPYKGAPFGLSIVTPAIAGPFNLGNVIVRSTINVDPNTAAVTITSDPLPTRLKGVPTQLQRVSVTVDRPGFQFNPTNCNPMSITGTLTGAQGGSADVSSPFQVINCASLPFKPTLTASTLGHSSKANGAAFVVKVTSGPGQANIGKTTIVLPKALPSRLTTIQKACVAAVFEANPASCPEGSNIGTATVHTPVLRNPLTGPAYLVSHGGAGFPDVEFVLQGEGITLVLDGKTNIHNGITSDTFNAVPDAPVTTFETVLPEGPHSALTANVPPSKKFSLCGTNLVMPTTLTGQNGAVIQQNTKIAVNGCKGGGVAGFMTRKQKLAKALKACKKKKNKAKRAACVKKAHKQFGAKKKSAKKKH